jgi:hypothetical protein
VVGICLRWLNASINKKSFNLNLPGLEYRQTEVICDFCDQHQTRLKGALLW